MMFERFVDWSIIPIHTLQSLGILCYILRRYLPTVDIYGGDAILRSTAYFYPFDLSCLRDSLLDWIIMFERFVVGLDYHV